MVPNGILAISDTFFGSLKIIYLYGILLHAVGACLQLIELYQLCSSTLFDLKYLTERLLIVRLNKSS